MAQSDNRVVVPNTVGATFRSNINKGLEGLASTFSGDNAPTAALIGLASIPEGFLWVDTAGAASILKVYNGTNFVAVDTNTVVTAAELNLGGVLGGTVANATIDANAVGSSQIDSNAVGVSELNGGTPSADQVLTASDSTTFAWTDAAGGGNGGLLNGAGTIEAKGNRMIVSGAGGGGGGWSTNGNAGGGGSGYWTYWGSIPVVKGETITVAIGTGGSGGTFPNTSGGNGNATNFNGSSSGSVIVALGGGRGRNNSGNAAGGTLTGTVNSSFQSGSGTGNAGSGSGSGQTGTIPWQAFAGNGGNGGSGDFSGGNTAAGGPGNSGWSLIHGFYDT